MLYFITIRCAGLAEQRSDWEFDSIWGSCAAALRATAILAQTHMPLCDVDWLKLKNGSYVTKQTTAIPNRSLLAALTPTCCTIEPGMFFQTYMGGCS